MRGRQRGRGLTQGIGLPHLERRRLRLLRLNRSQVLREPGVISIPVSRRLHLLRLYQLLCHRKESMMLLVRTIRLPHLVEARLCRRLLLKLLLHRLQMLAQHLHQLRALTLPLRIPNMPVDPPHTLMAANQCIHTIRLALVDQVTVGTTDTLLPLHRISLINLGRRLRQGIRTRTRRRVHMACKVRDRDSHKAAIVHPV